MSNISSTDHISLMLMIKLCSFYICPIVCVVFLSYWNKWDDFTAFQFSNKFCVMPCFFRILLLQNLCNLSRFAVDREFWRTLYSDGRSPLCAVLTVATPVQGFDNTSNTVLTVASIMKKPYKYLICIYNRTSVSKDRWVADYTINRQSDRLS